MKSISRQILVYLLASVGCLLAVVGGLLYFAIDRTLYHEFDHDLRRQAELLAAQVNTDEHGKVRLDLTLLPGRLSARTLLVLDEHNRVIFRSADAPVTDAPQLGFNDIDLHGEPYRIYTLAGKARPDEDDGIAQHRPAVPFTLIYGKSLAIVKRVDRVIAYAVAGAAVFSAAIAAAIVIVVVRRGLAPLNELGDKLNQLDAHSLKKPIRLQRNPAELHMVVERLNDLMRRLNDAFERQQRFTANAAHEFRTPIAEIHSVAEVALMRPWLGDQEKISYRDILQSTTRMQSLTTTLLSLARGGDVDAVLEHIDLRSAVENAVGRLRADAVETVHVNGPHSPTVKATPEAIDGILLNLLQNALEYRHGIDPVEVAISQDDAGARIEISNAVAVDDLPNITRFGEQFWRKSNSRTDGSHSGLGCALVKMYVATIGGQVQWKASMNGQPRIVSVVQFPAIST